MAGKPAPDTPLLAVRDVKSDEVLFVLPIDAREMVASKAYEFANDVEVPTPVAAPSRSSHIERPVEVRLIGTDTVLRSHAIDARELVASGAYEYVAGGPPSAIETVVQSVPDTLTPVDRLTAVLSEVHDADVLLAMEAKDERPEAKPFYEARFNELAAPRL